MFVAIGLRKKNIMAVYELVEDLMDQEEALADGACRCYGQACRYLSETDFQDVLEEQLDADEDLNWKELRTKCWTLCEILQSCPERLTEENWTELNEFIEENGERPEQPLENILVEMAYRRVEGLSRCGKTSEVGEAMEMLLAKKSTVQGDTAVNLSDNIKYLALNHRDVVDQFLQQYAEFLIALCCRHEQDVKRSAQIALQVCLDLKENQERYHSLLGMLETSAASVLKRVCKTIRY